MPYVDTNNRNPSANSAGRPIAIVNGSAGTARYWQWMTVAEAKQLVDDLQAAIAESESGRS